MRALTAPSRVSAGEHAPAGGSSERPGRTRGDRVEAEQQAVGNQALSRALAGGAPRDDSAPASRAGRMSVTVAHTPSTVIGPRAAISQSGDPTVLIKYAPEAGDKSTKIVFIQVMKTLLDGTAVKPGDAHNSFKYRDADTTADFFSVDYVNGEADPYYNGDDPGDKGANQKQGDATATPKVTASMDDTPNYSDGAFPAGKSKFGFTFRTYAFSAAGADKGTFYAYAKWKFNKEKGSASTISHDGETAGGPVAEDKTAIDLWCTNHGFTPPK